MKRAPTFLLSILAIAMSVGMAITPAHAAEPAAPAEATQPAAKGEMIAGGDGTKLFLRRDLPNGDVRAVLVIVHGLAYLKKNSKAFVDPVLVLTGNNDMCVSPQDAIDFYRETGSTDRSLRIYADVGHFLMAEEKGHMIGPEIITWIEDRLSGATFVDAGI